jgi:hypothetical protein
MSLSIRCVASQSPLTCRPGSFSNWQRAERIDCCHSIIVSRCGKNERLTSRSDDALEPIGYLGIRVPGFGPRRGLSGLRNVRVAKSKVTVNFYLLTENIYLQHLINNKILAKSVTGCGTTDHLAIASSRKARVDTQTSSRAPLLLIRVLRDIDPFQKSFNRWTANERRAPLWLQRHYAFRSAGREATS